MTTARKQPPIQSSANQNGTRPRESTTAQRRHPWVRGAVFCAGLAALAENYVLFRRQVESTIDGTMVRWHDVVTTRVDGTTTAA